MATLSEAIAIGLEHHKAGRLQAAEHIYRQILKADPNQPDTLHLLGVLAHQTGQLPTALDLIECAIARKPADHVFHNNLGNVLKALQRIDDAIAAYRQALQLKPDYAAAYNNLGAVLQVQGRRAEAIECYRNALELNSSVPEAHNNLGVACSEIGQFAEAISYLRQALSLKPDYDEAHNNLGNVFKYQGKWADAVSCYRRALQLRPNYAEALNNLGNVLKDQGKIDEAVACYRRSLELRQDDPEAWYSPGLLYWDQGRLDEAVAHHRRALDLKPDYTIALGSLVHELQHLCEWDRLAEYSQRLIDAVERGAESGNAALVSPFSFLALPTPTTSEQQLRCARQWVERQLKVASTAGGLVGAKPQAAKERITIGYLSGDLHAHATAWLIAELFEKHDRERFTINTYSYGPDDGSPMRQRLVRSFDRFVDIRLLSYGDAAERIRSDGVDILVDLKGYTHDSRTQIMALRPAPIQVNYLGYPGTMGADFIDYIVVDDFVVPPDQQPFFAEKLVYLPGSYQVNDSQRSIAERTPTRVECGLPDEGFVFCSFNNSYKITTEIFDVWMRLLHEAPGSMLWLLEGNRFAPANLSKEAEKRGVSRERLIFAPRIPLPEHLARHRLADLFLDTFPVNAHTTASDALWACLPILTLAGQTFVSRVAGSLLRTLGLPELIATTREEYEAMALRLAREPEMLSELRTRLHEARSKSTLFDAGSFARNLEAAFEVMWQTWHTGAQTSAIRIRPHEALNSPCPLPG